MSYPYGTKATVLTVAVSYSASHSVKASVVFRDCLHLSGLPSGAPSTDISSSKCPIVIRDVPGRLVLRPAHTTSGKYVTYLLWICFPRLSILVQIEPLPITGGT